MSTESPVQPSSSFTDLFIRRPVIAIVVNLVIIIAGIQAIRTLNVRQYPRSENATITVTTVYVGASADLVRGFITTPLERVIASAAMLVAVRRASSITSAVASGFQRQPSQTNQPLLARWRQHRITSR